MLSTPFATPPVDFLRYRMVRLRRSSPARDPSLLCIRRAHPILPRPSPYSFAHAVSTSQLSQDFAVMRFSRERVFCFVVVISLRFFLAFSRVGGFIYNSVSPAPPEIVKELLSAQVGGMA